MTTKSRHMALDQDEMMANAKVYQVQRVWDFIEETVVAELKEMKSNQVDIVANVKGLGKSMGNLATRDDLRDLEQRMDKKIDVKIEAAIGADKKDERKSRTPVLVAIITSGLALIGTIIGVIL